MAADDRTGAIETAAALADHGAGPVPVVVWPYRAPEHGTAAIEVVDLETRHVSADEAVERAVAVDRLGPCAHKIDSTLRGNWAVELAARHRVSRRPVLLIPALPAMNRICVGGVVLDHGHPVHEGPPDPRSRIRTSRPADLFDGVETTELSDRTEVEAWLSEPTGVAVADASSDDDIAGIVGVWRSAPEVLLAGTSAVIGASADHLGGSAPEQPEVGGPVLVVCGSIHPMARAQIAELEHRGVATTSIVDELTVTRLRDDGHLVLATEIPFGEIDTPLAIAAATTLARGVRDLLDRVDVGALVLLGGDTTAAVLGDADVLVHGTIASGTAWSTVDELDMPVITRAGGFGSDHALVELLWTVLA